MIADRMTEAKATVPEFQVQADVWMDALVALRDQAKAVREQPPSLNDLVVKAVALALVEHPRVNGFYDDGRLVLSPEINVGVAVAAEGTLVVPVVRNADRLSIGAIAAETRRLAEAVRTGAVTMGDLRGGTFTVSNLGMFGMTAITPILNLPQAAILGVGAARETVRFDGERPVKAHVATLTLTCDHRILYGADAARFLSRVRELLERPVALLLD
jgi:pyruvate dehydrogenase E2 component (dihydrolipoamide acetyltransferase)